MRAMDAMEELVAGMEGGWGLAWTDLSYQERQSGNQAPLSLRPVGAGGLPLPRRAL